MDYKIYEIKINGKKRYRAQISLKGAKPRRYKTMKSRERLEKFLRLKTDLIRRDTTGTLAKKFSIEQLADISEAMRLLPQGMTLTALVKRFARYASDTTPQKILPEFLATKENRIENQNYLSHVKSRLNAFAERFKTFDSATPDALLKWLKALKTPQGAPASPKTIKHYAGAVSSFFDFCKRREYIAENPFDKISFEDLPSVKAAPVGFLSVAQAEEFLTYLAQSAPEYLKFYAIAMFAGVRIEEAAKLSASNIDEKERKIIISAAISKTGRADVLEDIEPNFWEWMDYCAGSPITQPKDLVRTNFSKKLSFPLPHNFARHSFATYHYSLYLDARRTCAITRHSEEMLKRHYLGARVQKDVARAYFSITPDSLRCRAAIA